jgi:hypothetical protein
MGWINSPPTFSAVTETACGIANERMYRQHALSINWALGRYALMTPL